MNSPKTQLQPEIAGVTSLELSRQPFGASAQCNISYLLYIISYYHLLSFCYQKNCSMHSMHTLWTCLLCFPFCLPRSSLGDLIVLSRAWLPSIGHPVVSYHELTRMAQRPASSAFCRFSVMQTLFGILRLFEPPNPQHHLPLSARMVSCCGESLLVLTTQYLKQTVSAWEAFAVLFSCNCFTALRNFSTSLLEVPEVQTQG